MAALPLTPPLLSPASSLSSGEPYGSPAGDCRLLELHGLKVASFRADGEDLVCLPQVFELFLKHLVGGLHTVYTKLKRLDIRPVVCTVEQVRVLRGLGAIQPGVNRCKLISLSDFQALYRDCTSASSRPGRPPKRSLSTAMHESSRLLPHGVHTLLPPGLLSTTGLTAAAMAEAMKLQNMKLMALKHMQGPSSQNGTESEGEELNSSAGGSDSSWDKEKLQSPSSVSTQPASAPAGFANRQSSNLSSLQQNQLLANRLELPFMMMSHPLLPVSLPPASVAMAMSQMNHLSTMANMAAAASQMHNPLHRAEASVIKERLPDSPSPSPSLEETPDVTSQPPSQPSSSVCSSPYPEQQHTDCTDGDIADQDAEPAAKRMLKDKDSQVPLPLLKPSYDKQAKPPGIPPSFLFADGLSSVEMLLTNIQSLLKVAVENARLQEKQIQQEKKDLRLEVFRERELREKVERQLAVELQSRTAVHKRLKREKKAKRKLQEALQQECRRREQAEQALKQATAVGLNETVTTVMEPEHNGGQQESSATQMYIKAPLLY